MALVAHASACENVSAMYHRGLLCHRWAHSWSWVAAGWGIVLASCGEQAGDKASPAASPEATITASSGVGPEESSSTLTSGSLVPSGSTVDQSMTVDTTSASVGMASETGPATAAAAGGAAGDVNLQPSATAGSTGGAETPPTDDPGCEGSSPGAFFDQRIAPLLAEDRPKTCNQCHLSGVDLGAFVRDDACETMACLVEDGLVDLGMPEQSSILGWIQRASPDSEQLTEQVITEEYDGFLEWIEFSARCGGALCPDVACGPRDEALNCPVGAPLDPAATEDTAAQCDSLTIERLFLDNVFAWRNRCSPCHVDTTAEGIAGEPSPWIRTSGSCEEASLATLNEVERRGLIDFMDPAQSLLVQKPLADRVTHGGSEKFHDMNDATYQGFMLFIDRYVQCKAP